MFGNGSQNTTWKLNIICLMNASSLWEYNSMNSIIICLDYGLIAM